MTFQQRERVIRGQVNTEHVVHLFDDTESLAETVAEFLFEGWARDEVLLVVARSDNWSLACRRLIARGCPVNEAIASGQLVILDAATTLATILRNDHPVPERFAASVGGIVHGLATRSGRRLRIYGEMVDILAAQGELIAARELERLWNELGTKYSFTLMCGYASGHFGDPRTVAALCAICDEHSHATAKPNDLLGSWLLENRQSWHQNAPSPFLR